MFYSLKYLEMEKSQSTARIMFGLQAIVIFAFVKFVEANGGKIF